MQETYLESSSAPKAKSNCSSSSSFNSGNGASSGIEVFTRSVVEVEVGGVRGGI